MRRDRPAPVVLRVLTVVSAGLLVLAGCADAPSDAAAPAPSPPPLRTSGPLADGFEIQPGSGLVGAVFPVGSFSLGMGEGWQAVLRVDGDAERVFDGYVRQAEALGQQMDSGWCCRPEGQWCSDDDPPGAFAVGCTAFTHPPDVESLSLSLRGFVDADGRGYIHIRADGSDRDVEPFPSVPDGPVAPLTDVEVAPDLTPESDDPPVRVVAGSALIADPIPSACGTGGYVAVLQATGELPPILRSYRDQFTSAGFGTEGLTGKDDLLRVSAETAGGGNLSAVAVAGDPALVLLERCND